MDIWEVPRTVIEYRHVKEARAKRQHVDGRDTLIEPEANLFILP
ncbi:hypothetical protein AB0G32_11800 [Streptomyces sp. NPDC023723]